VFQHLVGTIAVGTGPAFDWSRTHLTS